MSSNADHFKPQNFFIPMSGVFFLNFPKLSEPEAFNENAKKYYQFGGCFMDDEQAKSMLDIFHEILRNNVDIFGKDIRNDLAKKFPLMTYAELETKVQEHIILNHIDILNDMKIKIPLCHGDRIYAPKKEALSEKDPHFKNRYYFTGRNTFPIQLFNKDGADIVPVPLEEANKVFRPYSLCTAKINIMFAYNKQFKRYFFLIKPVSLLKLGEMYKERDTAYAGFDQERDLINRINLDHFMY